MSASLPKGACSSEVATRVIVAIPLVLITLVAIYMGGWYWKGVLAVVALQLTREWWCMVAPLSRRYSISSLMFKVLFLLLCLNAAWLLANWRQEYGSFVVYLAIFTAAATDSCAYILGRMVGGPKLAPKLSPNKTVSGTLGGVLGGGVFAFMLLRNIGDNLLPSFLLSLAAVIGDLTESLFKRHLKVKDSGAILPGHGGIFDRVDSVIAVCYMILIVGPKSFLLP